MRATRLSVLFGIALLIAGAGCGSDSTIGDPASISGDDGSGSSGPPDRTPPDGLDDQPGDQPGDGGGETPGDGGDGGETPGDGGGETPGDGGGEGPDCEADPLAAGCVEDGPGEEGSPIVDQDNDTIRDRDEGNCAVDSDFDGTPDCLDLDSDGDGIPDSLEAGDTDPLTLPFDFDGDDQPDYLDLDSDNDGIDDLIEGPVDTDRDGAGDWIDLDSDGDGIRDEVEGLDDPDADGVPNYIDQDSDGDYIPDWFEAFGDVDGDEIADRFDLDSDGDGVPDAVEAGDEDLATPPRDTDEDGLPDFQDRDSDGDGLPDISETGCPAATDRLLTDSDGDGYGDLAEVAVGSNACSATSDVYDQVEFFFILPPEVEETAPLEFSTDVLQADVHINMDTTGSMIQEITALQNDLQLNIIPGIDDLIEDAAFGVSSFRDFPISNGSVNFGGTGDYPFRLDQAITTSAAAAQAGTGALVAGGGADGPESGWESLYQIATGAGGVTWGTGSIPPSDIGWRDGSLPVVVHITDAPSHSASDYGSWVDGEHSRDDTVSALDSASTRVIGVASGSAVRTELRALAEDTGAVVPVCAFRDSSCGTDMCCTGIGGTGEAPVGDTCPLVFNINSNGSGLSASIVDAIDFLVTASTIEVTTRVIRDEVAYSAGVDTSCFISAVIPNHAEAPDTCAGNPRPADNYAPEGVDDSFVDVTPGTFVYFDVFAENDGCVEPTDQPQAFRATIEVIGDGVTVLDTLEVTIIIPPLVLDGDKE